MLLLLSPFYFIILLNHCVVSKHSSRTGNSRFCDSTREWVFVPVSPEESFH